MRDIWGISIHTLRVEGDDDTHELVDETGISIHTLRVEGDPTQKSLDPKGRHFNPHPPRGG